MVDTARLSAIRVATVCVSPRWASLALMGVGACRDSEVHPERNPVLRLVVPMTRDFEDEKFFVRKAGMLYATPLFAVDSIPAIFAITSSAFVVWAANASAVLGLRPLYFMLEGMIRRIVYLPFIATVVTASIVASLWKTRGLEREADVPVGKS